MGLDMTKPVFGVSHKENSNQSPQLKILARQNCNFVCSKFSCDTFQSANNKGADQTVWMHRLVCAFVVRNPEDRFSHVEACICLT